MDEPTSARLDQEKIWEEWYDARGAERYWNHKGHNKRSKWFSGFISKYGFSSVFEVGVNCGRNLHYIVSAMPETIVGGIDINREAIEFAKNKIPSANLECGSAYDLNVDDKYDMVFTSGTLLHIPPKEVPVVLAKCAEKANNYVMHMETQGPDKVINGPAEFKPTKKVHKKIRCEHNYVRMYSELGYEASFKIIPGCGEVDALHIIVVKVK